MEYVSGFFIRLRDGGSILMLLCVAYNAAAFTTTALKALITNPTPTIGLMMLVLGVIVIIAFGIGCLMHSKGDQS